MENVSRRAVLQTAIDLHEPKYDRCNINQLRDIISRSVEAILWTNSLLRRGAGHVLANTSDFPPEMTTAFNARNSVRAARKLRLIPAEV